VTKKLQLNAVKALSMVSSRSYLQRVFEKNVEKLISNTDTSEQKSRNLEVLLQVMGSVSMSQDFINKCVSLVKSYMLSNEPFFEKMSYKLLIKIVPKMHSSFMKEIIKILLSHSNIKAGTKQIRLACVSCIFDISSAHVVQAFLPEIVTAVRQTNNKTRKTAKDLLSRVAGSLGEEQLVSLITAGFGGSSSLIKADPVAAITSLMKGLSPQFVGQLLPLVLLLTHEKNREVYRAVLKFLKQYLKAAAKEDLKAQLAQIMDALLKNDERSKDVCIALVKHFIEKCIRKLGKETVKQLTPLEHQKLVPFYLLSYPRCSTLTSPSSSSKRKSSRRK